MHSKATVKHRHSRWKHLPRARAWHLPAKQGLPSVPPVSEPLGGGSGGERSAEHLAAQQRQRLNPVRMMSSTSSCRLRLQRCLEDYLQPDSHCCLSFPAAASQCPRALRSLFRLSLSIIGCCFFPPHTLPAPTPLLTSTPCLADSLMLAFPRPTPLPTHFAFNTIRLPHHPTSLLRLPLQHLTPHPNLPLPQSFHSIPHTSFLTVALVSQ